MDTTKWVAYTTVYSEAKKYWMKFDFIKAWGEKGMWFFKMFHKENGKYFLPVHMWKQAHVTPPTKTINPITDIMLLDKQNDALDYVKGLVSQWEKSCMIVSETATGKSYLLMATAFAINKPTVIVAPRKGILAWLYEKFHKLADIRAMKSSEVNAIDPDDLPAVLLISAASFNKCYDRLNENYDVLLLDEVHRTNENRVSQINKRCGIFVMWVSGTPQRKEFWIEWFEMLFKNIYHTWLKSLDAKILTYEFYYDYSIEEVEAATEWLPPTHPEIYRRLYIPNEERTQRLVNIIRNLKYGENWFKRMIIFTDRTDHINRIYEKLCWIYDKDKIIIMDGKNNIEEAIAKANSVDEYIIVWQMASSGEWVDITNLEIWILFQSTRWINTIEQAIWRMKRKYKWKELAYFVDFIDSMRLNWSKKKKLWRYDRKAIYKKQWYEVIKLKEFLATNNS